MTLDTASAREALWEAIADRSHVGDEAYVNAAIDAYAEAIRRQTVEEVWLKVKGLITPLQAPSDAVVVFHAWILDAIAREADA